MLNEFAVSFQTYLMYACIAGLVAMLAALVVMKAVPFFDTLWHDYLHLDGVGRVVVGVCVTMAAMYGGSKGGFWGRVSSDGADTGIGLVGVFTAVSNDVQTVGGVVTTNQIPMVAVMWTNGTVTASTDVSFRFSNTNQWSSVVKTSPRIYADGTTNILEFVTSENFSSYKYWWVGSDKPAVVIISSEITINTFSEDSHGVSITWSCTDARATEFVVWTKKLTDQTWTQRAVVNGYSVRLTGFFVGEDMDYKITSTFLEDGE